MDDDTLALLLEQSRKRMAHTKRCPGDCVLVWFSDIVYAFVLADEAAGGNVGEWLMLAGEALQANDTVPQPEHREGW